MNGSQPSGSPAVSLSGTGIAPVAALTPSLTFDPQVVGTTSAAQTLTLSNNGDATLDISSITAGSDFSQTNSCPNAVAPGASCTIQVSFTPSASGVRNGRVAVLDDDPAGGTQTSALIGTGVDFSVSVSPASATIRSGQTAQFTVTVTAVAGAFPSAITLNCSGVPAASSCSVSPNAVSPGSGSASATMSVVTSIRHGNNHGTPSGTFPITVTGNALGLQHLATINLIVQ